MDYIKRQQSNRKRNAALYFVMAIVFATISIYGYQYSLDNTKQSIESLVMLHPGNPIMEVDVKLAHTTNELALAIGIKLGVFVGTSMATIGFIIASAFTLLCSTRKTELLIKHYDK